MSTDALTGIQAVERTHATLPLKPGYVEDHECAYIRPGPHCCIVTCMVASGKLGTVASGPTRDETDFLQHIQRTVAAQPASRTWHFIGDQLTIQCAASLGRDGAEESASAADLGVTGQSGSLHSMTSRAAFLADPTHRLVLHDTPTHASGMNQGASWFSILARKVLRRGHCSSLKDLIGKVLAFIAYDNETMAKPFRWTYQGKALER